MLEGSLPSSCATYMRALPHIAWVQVKAGLLEGALEWSIATRDKLSNHGAPTKLEFKLRRLIFLEVLQKQGALRNL
jgi:hypothetical protein